MKILTENDLVGKTVKEIDVTGYNVVIIFTDNTEFRYYASDGGYSSWDIINGVYEL